MKVLVIGTGAVGCAVAIAAAHAGMAHAGMDTALLARSATAEYIQEHGLKRTGIFGELEIEPGTRTAGRGDQGFRHPLGDLRRAGAGALGQDAV